MWLNIDKPTKMVTLHEDQCSYIPTTDSKNKRLNNLGTYGGWLKFSNREEALQFYEENYSEFERGYCYYCGTEKLTPKNEVELYNQLSEKELEELREFDGNTPWNMRNKR